jgi:hypothetical protein
VKTHSRLNARIAILAAAVALLLSMLACGGIIPQCTDVECSLAGAGCLICRGTSQ